MNSCHPDPQRVEGGSEGAPPPTIFRRRTESRESGRRIPTRQFLATFPLNFATLLRNGLPPNEWVPPEKYAAVVDPRRFHKGKSCLHFPKALFRNESRSKTPPEKELDLGRVLKNSQNESSQNGILYSDKY